jgi:hypothetical protein
MYYPYLRGKQYELIALRELMEKDLINDKIVPIVEPIIASPYLLKFMDIYVKANRNFGIIQNPEYGTFLQEIERNEKREYKEKFSSFFTVSQYCLPVFIFNKNIDRIEPLSVEQKSIAVCAEEDVISSIPELEPKYNIDRFMIPDERIFKREIAGNKILMADNFKKQQRNADYANSDDDFFSDDHLYFAEENYKGFSDFSIIGKEYTESGFAPYAVAIHMVYFDREKKLRVHHFVSNSNDDYGDTPGKLEEALEKLVTSSLINNNTYAYNELKRFYDNRIYSGLGVIKKLSLMHHIELLSRYLQERNIE